MDGRRPAAVTAVTQRFSDVTDVDDEATILVEYPRLRIIQAPELAVRSQGHGDSRSDWPSLLRGDGIRVRRGRQEEQRQAAPIPLQRTSS
jgi:hypothetical protein